MNNSLIAVALAVATISTAAASEYRVRALRPATSELLVTLDLLKQSGKPRTLISRAASLGLKSQVHAPRCGKRLLQQKSDGTWTVPAWCSKVAWVVRAVAAVEGKTDASSQATVKFQNPSWFLFSDPTSLLRLQGDDQPSTIIFHGLSKGSSSIGATEVSNNVWRVPALNNAPEFFAFGRLSSKTRNIGLFTVRYIADNDTRVARLGLENMHERALQFLANVLQPATDAPSIERSLLVIWVGIDEATGRAGGAAGSRSFVANYVFGKPESEPLNAARTLAILAHEQFHQLVDLARGKLPPLPNWINESLAHYYGLKALERSTSSLKSKSVRARFIDPLRPVASGLLELNRRYKANDRSVYSLFYEQGATFWSEVDSAISAATNGTASLDDIVPEIVRSATAGNDGLPESFVTRLREIIGVKTDELMSKYVGS